MDLHSLTPEALSEVLEEANITRFYFVYNEAQQKVIASHSFLQPLADFLREDTADFTHHEGLFFENLPRYQTILGAFVHKTNRGQAAGGLRFWNYTNMESFLRDGLRLSKGMTRKNALAGIWWGGGKGIITHNPALNKRDPAIRKALYTAYGHFVTSLQGCYITAEDVGTNVADMAHIFQATRFATCIPPTVGGSGNPSVPTARGVIAGIEGALQFLNMGKIEGKTFAVQGMGNVGGPVIQFLFEKGAKSVVATDIDPLLVNQVKASLQGQSLTAFASEPQDTSIFEQPCDVFVPCAVGAILNPETIPLLQTKIVCGAANNQLAQTLRDGKNLMDRGILYVPDFLVNRMGIVTCADEQAGYVHPDPMIEQHLSKDWEFSVYQTTLRVLEKAHSEQMIPAQVAIELADEASKQTHPVYGHRGKLIIRSLVAKDWAL